MTQQEKHLLQSVLLLAMKTGWSEEAIFKLPYSRFKFYIDKITPKDATE